MNRQQRAPMPTAKGSNDYDLAGVGKAAGIASTWATQEYRRGFKICKHTIASMFINKIRVQEPNTFPSVDTREKFEAKLRTTDGHFVRSKAEMLIDNWLYMAEIVHAYERKLPIEEDVYCDFYIPTGKVYIEYWGYENNPKYTARKRIKQEIYQKYAFSLIEVEDKDVQNLDDILPRLLLKFGVQAY